MRKVFEMNQVMKRYYVVVILQEIDNELLSVTFRWYVDRFNFAAKFRNGIKRLLLAKFVR